MQAPRAGTSRAGKRKHKEVDQEPYVVCKTILAEKKKLAEKMLQVLERDHLLLNELAGVIKWSPFPIVAMKHLKSDEENRQAFIAFSSDDDKISNLEHMLGVMIYGGL
ncbi:hypothetical protein Bca101_088199 [Brassica carinata]